MTCIDYVKKNMQHIKNANIMLATEMRQSATWRIVLPVVALNIVHTTWSMSNIEAHVRPMIPDDTYTLFRYPAQTSSFTAFVDGPLSKPCSGYQIDNFSCSVLWRGVEACGIAILDYWPEKDFDKTHHLGQILYAYMMKYSLNVTSALRQLAELALIKLAVNTVGGGPYHGALWYGAARVAQYGNWSAFWDVMLNSWFPNNTSTLLFIHGISHVGLVHDRVDDPCDYTPHFTSRKLLYDSMQPCIHAPTPMLREMCANGYYHGIVEYFDEYGVVSPSALYPCDSTWFAPQQCFFYFFVYVGHKRWRYDEFSAVDGDLSNICTDANIAESNVRACIYGMSSLFFPLFDRVASSNSARSQYAVCVRESAAMYYFDRVISGNESVGRLTAHCNLLLKAGHIQRTPLTLVGWCSRFTDSLADARSRLRWMACIAGSFFWSASAMYRLEYGRREMGSTLYQNVTYSRFCPQLLGVRWPNESERQEIYNTCIQVTSPHAISNVGFGNTDILGTLGFIRRR